MEGAPQEGRFDDRSGADLAGQVLTAKAGQARPQPDVWRPRQLRLEGNEVTHRGTYRQVGAVQEELAREGRPVQFPRRHALRGRTHLNRYRVLRGERGNWGFDGQPW